MSKSKISSKNNPTTREKAKEYFYNGKKIKPVKFIFDKSSFFAAEYEESGDLVLVDGKVLSWINIRNMI